MFENGFVLLSNNSFDEEKFITDFKKDWQINAQFERSQGDEILTISVDDFTCFIALMPAPIPNNEAVERAKFNYYCPDAVEIAQKHQAHLMVTVMRADKDNPLIVMQLYSKIIYSLLKQKNATAVYTIGTVYSADFYQKVIEEYLNEDAIPIMVWVYIGLERTEQGHQLYTAGMDKFGKEEMEILNNKADITFLHNALNVMCSYIISSGLQLEDGETIGFSAEQKWHIHRSKSIYSPSEFSLKIDIN